MTGWRGKHWRGGRPQRGRGSFSQREQEAEASSSGHDGGQPVQRNDFPTSQEFFEVRRYLRQDLPADSPSRTAHCYQVWSKALEVINQNVGDLQHAVARDLASDDFRGLDIVAYTAKICGSATENSFILKAAEHCLLVITHQSLVDSQSVDCFLGVIYRTLAGTASDRAIAMFRGICRRLQGLAAQALETSSSCTAKGLITPMLDALSQLLNRERRARFNDGISPLLEDLDGLIELIAVGSRTSRYQGWKDQLGNIRRVIRISIDRLQAEEEDIELEAQPGVASQPFPLAQELPGGRHDNDHADIRRIQILPTLQEISCDHAEYLPSTELLRPHHLNDPVQRHIDTMFRLLRHDVFQTVKDVLNELLSHKGEKPLRIAKNDMRAHTYHAASLGHMFMHGRQGLLAVLAFATPSQVQSKSKVEQRRWWEESSRLEEGSLVCLLTTKGQHRSLLFLEIVKRCTVESKGIQQPRDDETEESHVISTCLVPRDGGPSLEVKLATQSQHDLKLLVELCGQNSDYDGTLVEFHGLLPATFSPILQNLQLMMDEGRFPFERWLLPQHEGTAANPDEIPPPAYSRKADFRFWIKSIMREGLPSDIRSKLFAGRLGEKGTRYNIRLLKSTTTLDEGQCKGLLAALTREFALIQGPPGTGKSYVGVQIVRVLLENKARAKLGPLLIICYTNHALDQFLAHLMDDGIKKVIRIGGRSAEQRLLLKNLRVVSKDVSKTRVEGQKLGQTFKDLETVNKLAEKALDPLRRLQKGATWAMLKEYLSQESPSIYGQLSKDVDDDGFVSVGRDPFTLWLGATRLKSTHAKFQSQQEIDECILLQRRAERDVNTLAQPDRARLVASWMSALRQRHEAQLFEYLAHIDKDREIIDNVHDDVNRRALLQADVIGITTTALAKNIALLRHVRSKVVICEEAGEVMEPHILSALMPSVEHMIQIGDHRQLRPQINNYSSSTESSSGTKYQLDRSQFERRAVGEPGLQPAPVAQLNVQRRMRPRISDLIRGIYPNLEDHSSVEMLPDVVGMRHNVFWLEHNHFEDSASDGARVRSHSNTWEVDMAAGLVRHLVRQGKYSSTDIALLTPYTGQLRKLRRALRDDFEIFLSDRDQDTLNAEGVDDEDSTEIAPNVKGDLRNARMLVKKTLDQTLRLATVDNFQGEEAKVIIVSLVRSNAKGNVGFLRTENRINVLLSRAQHGMYLIGNAETYKGVGMWAKVYEQMGAHQGVGTSFSLCCPRHPATDIVCSEPQDFVRKSPEGGCELPCDRRLPACGHRCHTQCHSDMLHQAVACLQPCARIRETCNHICSKLCGQECGPCQVQLEDTRLPCGHRGKVACHQMLDLSVIQCTVKVQKRVPGCGHVIEVQCHRRVDTEFFRCPTPCNSGLDCGHSCQGTCGYCSTKSPNGTYQYEHRACSKVCDRPFGICNHRCPKKCHPTQACGGCRNKCEVQCPHSSCDKLCDSACAPCIEPCAWACSHQGKCSMPCAAPCDRLPCDERCDKTLLCGHRCPSFCGEDCPEGYCHQCSDKLDHRVDMLEFKEYSEIDVDETPVVVLSCGHFFTGETLDGMIGITSAYTVDRRGEINGLRSLSDDMASKVPSCPDCKQQIRQFATKRYNRVVNRAVMDETIKRFIAKGSESLHGLQLELATLTETFEAAASWDKPKLEEPAVKLDVKARKLYNEMDVEHQPSKMLHDAIRSSRQRAGAHFGTIPMQLGEAVGRMSLEDVVPPPPFDKRVMLGASLVRVKAQELRLQPWLSVNAKQGSELNGKEGDKVLAKRAVAFLKSCDGLCKQADEASLLRIKIGAVLSLAKIARLSASYCQSHDNLRAIQQPFERDEIKARLSSAFASCAALRDEQGVSLSNAVLSMQKFYESEWYEAVSPEELAQIKTAMVSGPQGMDTHSGHWYNCENGHPFAIGECGMAMEEARCPECGARVGGRDHQLRAGNTRATQMEL